MRSIAMTGFVLLAACGDDGMTMTPADATNVPAMITVSGEATKREGLSESPGARYRRAPACSPTSAYTVWAPTTASCARRARWSP